MAGKEAGDWFNPWRFAAVLGLLIVVCFPHVVAGFETFYYVDYGQFGYPLALYHRESIWRGEMPLWNPLNDCGVPFLAQWNTLTLYPVSLFYVLFPLSWSLGMFCLGHLFLAGLGMYFLAYRWTGNRLAAAVAGVAFGFNGLTWYGLMWPNNMAALGWMPWVVLAGERAWREGRGRLPVAALAGALQLLSGAPEVSLLTWLLIGVLWLAQLLEGEIPRWQMMGRALGVGGLATGLAAAQLLPFLDLLVHSQRHSGYGNASLLALPLTGWVNYLLPLFHCARNRQGMFVQPYQTWVGSYYVGVGIVALALLAVWRTRDRRVRLLMTLGVFGLLMAMGSRGLVYGGLTRLVPQLGFMRFPVKFVVLTTFVLPLLAACGLSWLQALPAESWPREWRRVKGLALGLAGLMAVILWWAWKWPRPADDLTATIRNGLGRALFLALVLGCIALLRRAADLKLQRLLQTGLIALLWFDVFTHTTNLSPTVARSAFEPDTIRQFFKWDNQPQAGAARAMQSKAAFWRMLSTGSEDPETDTNGRRLSLFLNFNLLDHIPKFDGFYSLDLKEYVDLFKEVYFTTNEAARLKDFLGISYINNPTNIVDWVRRDSFLPLITAGQQPVFANRAETLKALVGDRFEPRRTVYLPLEARSKVHATNQTNVRIVSSQFSPHRVGIEVEAPGPAMVVVAQAFYHPWQAYVDGKPTPLWRANYAFQALEVPFGKHRVSLVYEDNAFFCGIVLSLVSMLACGGTWFANIYGPHSGSNTQPGQPIPLPSGYVNCH